MHKQLNKSHLTNKHQYTHIKIKTGTGFEREVSINLYFMKKVILSLTALAASAVIAQAQVKFGVVGGGNLSHPNVEIANNKAENKWAPGFYIGGIADIQLHKNFSIQPGIQLSYKPYYNKTETTLGPATITSKSRVNPYFIEVPVNLVGKMEAGNGKVFVSAGPYIAYGIAGNIKTDVTGSIGGVNGNTSSDESIKWGNEKTTLTNSGDNLKPFDFGLNFGLGYEFNNGLLVNGGYQLGLTNLSPNGDDNNHYKNGMLKLGVGYMF